MSDRSTRPPKVCECGTVFMPKPNNYAKAIRCPVCAAKRRGTGSATRPSRRRDSAQNERHRAKQREETGERIRRRRFIGIDGEGITEPYSWHNELWEEGDPDHDVHRYRYMSAWQVGPDGLSESLGELEPRSGETYLRTRDVLWWLWKISRKTPEERKAKIPGPSLWFYSGTYDWTHTFRDIAIEDPDTLREILKKDREDPFEVTWWHGWGIVSVQSSVQLTRRVGTDDNGEPKYVNRFFQDGFKCWGGGSFVAQLKSWKVGTPEEIALIEKMKAERAYFTDIDQEVRDYCAMEVRLLAEMAQKITLIAEGLGIRPMGGKAYSAGSYAKALLRRHDVLQYRGTDRYAGGNDRIQDIIMRAFFGGWFDLFETGLFEVLYMIDLASAYPAVIRVLPCLAHGHWEDGRSADPRALTFGHVAWEPDDYGERRVGPFPFRVKTGHTMRPSIGRGWYVGELIDSAKRLGGYDIEEIDWVSFVPECDHNPFGWVQDVYDQRLRLGKDGPGLVLKVSLNSVYGTFADTLAHDSKYASMVWAATITGRTQAKLLDVIAEYGDDVVGVATDGIQAKRPIVTDAKQPMPVLGTWDYEGVITDVMAVQPGLYLAGGGESPKKMARSRGHALRDMRNIEAQIRSAWRRDGWNAAVTYTRTRFYPARLALARKNPLEFYGQWIDEDVTVKLTPSGRHRVDVPGLSKPSVIPFGVVNGIPEEEESAPYNKLLAMKIRQDLIDAKELEDAQPV